MIEITRVMKDFFELIESVETPNIRKFVYAGLNIVPEDFWLQPTSSSGRYHPPESNITPMGILIHNIKSCTIAKSLFGFFGLYDPIDKDIVIASILLHDTFKGGWGAWDGMIPEHGYIAASVLADIEMEDEYVKGKILKCIETHMSRWARPFKSASKFFFPEKTQLIVALSDMIASRRNISFYPGVSVLELDEDE